MIFYIFSLSKYFGVKDLPPLAYMWIMYHKIEFLKKNSLYRIKVWAKKV